MLIMLWIISALCIISAYFLGIYTCYLFVPKYVDILLTAKLSKKTKILSELPDKKSVILMTPERDAKLSEESST